MKILIADYAELLMPTHDLETQVLKDGLGEECEVEVYEYTDEKRDEFYERLSGADALLTGFIEMDAEAMDHALGLKVISINARWIWPRQTAVILECALWGSTAPLTLRSIRSVSCLHWLKT